MEELRKTRHFKAEELKEYCKREPSVWKLMFITQPTPLLEQHSKQQEILLEKKTYRVAPLPFCISLSWRHFIKAQVNSPVASEREHIHPQLPPWEDWEQTSFLFHLAPCQSLWGPSKIFHRPSFPLSSANSVKSKLFIRILSPWFLTWWGKFSEILDSYTHTQTSPSESATFWLTALHY